jgi:hypothetical protein
MSEKCVVPGHGTIFALLVDKSFDRKVRKGIANNREENLVATVKLIAGSFQ